MLFRSCLGAIYSWFIRSRQGNFQVALYFAFLPIFVIAFRDGVLITVAKTGVFYITPVFVWMWAARALGIPDPVDLARRAVRGRRVEQVGAAISNSAAPVPTSRRRVAGGEIIPRAWRNQSGTQRAQ